MCRILKVAKRLKIFTLEDIVMFCDIDADTAEKFIRNSDNIKPIGNKFEHVETIKTEGKFKIIDKNIPSKNSDVTVIDACEEFLKIKYKTLKPMSYQTYKTLMIMINIQTLLNNLLILFEFFSMHFYFYM